MAPARTLGPVSVKVMRATPFSLAAGCGFVASGRRHEIDLPRRSTFEVSHIGLGESHRPALDRIPRAGHGHFLPGHPVVTIEVGPLDPAMREQVKGIAVTDLDSGPTRNLLDIGPAHALHRLLLLVEVGAARENSESERQRKAKLVHTNLDVPKD
jgi:hypothetical protein